MIDTNIIKFYEFEISGGWGDSYLKFYKKWHRQRLCGIYAHSSQTNSEYLFGYSPCIPSWTIRL